MGSSPASYAGPQSRTDDLLRLRRRLTLSSAYSFDQFRSCTMFGRSMRKCAALMLSTVMVHSGLRLSGIGHTSEPGPPFTAPKNMHFQISAPSRELFVEPT